MQMAGNLYGKEISGHVNEEQFERGEKIHISSTTVRERHGASREKRCEGTASCLVAAMGSVPVRPS
jgi:hypothetical protein